MRIKRALFNRVLPTLTVLILGLSACTFEQAPVDAQSGDQIPVAVSFRELYQTLGGAQLLGPPISEMFEIENKECQYTRNVLMCYDALATEIERFSLYPLGNHLNLVEPSAAEAPPEVFEEFQYLYDKLGGERFAGRALTSARTNYYQNRIEQYFGNVGFYRSLTEPAGGGGLLAYGAYTCTQQCLPQPDDIPGAVVLPASDSVEQPFLNSLIRIDGLAVFGRPLTRPYTAADGAVEQVYENVVLYVPAKEGQSMALRPVPELTGIQPDPLEPPSEKRGMIFYPLADDGLGLHVPDLFDRFIARHGGMEISGPPITSMQHINDDLYRQCFRSYCLEYRHLAPENAQIHLSALGADYLHSEQLDPSLIVHQVFSPDTIQLDISEAAPTVRADETQNIVIRVHTIDQVPVAGTGALLQIKLPDGRELAGVFPPTDSEGSSSLVVRPVDELPNGSVIAYEVCLNVPSADGVCAAGSYMIWNNE